MEFDVPSSEEPKTHLIALRFPSGALSAAQCAAWFDAVDGAYKLALIDDPSVPTPIIERFESGSIWQWVKDVPESAVPALKEMFRRLVLPEQTKLQTLAQSADLLADLTDKVAAGRLAPADADLIRHKVLRIAEVLPPGQQILLQIDNEPIVAGEVPPTLPRADQKALPPSTRTRRRRPVN